MPVDTTIIRRGIVDALSLFVSAIPFALVFGLAVVESGISPLAGWSSSWLVFGGAAQLTLVTLLGSGTAAVAAVTAALIVNARHLMYSAALTTTFQRQPRWFRWLGSYLLIDQVFALSALRLNEDPLAFRCYYLAAGATFWLSWNLCTAIGLFVGPVIPPSWHLGFAVPILFIGLLVMGINRWPKAVAALVAGLVTWLGAELPHRSSLLVGAAAGIAVGTLLDRIRR